jgi:hypothetical protein
MYALVDTVAKTYTACTPVLARDRPLDLGLLVGTLPGGWYLRGRLAGEPPGVYGHIATGMAELESSPLLDQERPLVEFYRRRDRIDLWAPISV